MESAGLSRSAHRTRVGWPMVGFLFSDAFAAQLMMACGRDKLSRLRKKLVWAALDWLGIAGQKRNGAVSMGE